MSDEERSPKSKHNGIKSMRATGSAGKKPMHPCDNCKCSRYSPCHCQRKKK